MKISFGAMCLPVSEQAGVIGDPAKIIDRAAESIVYLSVHGFLIDSEKHNARKRIMRYIERAICQQQRPAEPGKE